jgi:hypothetical protein
LPNLVQIGLSLTSCWCFAVPSSNWPMMGWSESLSGSMR